MNGCLRFVEAWPEQLWRIHAIRPLGRNYLWGKLSERMSSLGWERTLQSVNLAGHLPS